MRRRSFLNQDEPEAKRARTDVVADRVAEFIVLEHMQQEELTRSALNPPNAFNTVVQTMTELGSSLTDNGLSLPAAPLVPVQPLDDYTPPVPLEAGELEWCVECEEDFIADRPSPCDCKCKHWTELCGGCWQEFRDHAYGDHKSSDTACGFVPGCTICRQYQRYLCAEDEEHYKDLKAAWDQQAAFNLETGHPPPAPLKRIFTLNLDFTLTRLPTPPPRPPSPEYPPEIGPPPPMVRFYNSNMTALNLGANWDLPQVYSSLSGQYHVLEVKEPQALHASLIEIFGSDSEENEESAQEILELLRTEHDTFIDVREFKLGTLPLHTAFIFTKNYTDVVNGITIYRKKVTSVTYSYSHGTVNTRETQQIDISVFSQLTPFTD